MTPHASSTFAPAALAQCIAALDWSGVSLQHLLAVTAAVETLLALAPITSLEPTLDHADLVVFAPESSNVLPFPRPARPAPHTRTVRLLTLQGAEWCTAGFLPGDPGAAWGWVVEVVAHELGVREEDIGCVEDPEGGGDLVTVEGLPCYRVAHGPV